ncbi:MAG: hypothetical protein JNL32_04485 [Candidatus Kapabacteria bacterium]|nr:hypothetical protein [Candidatus Kapabacteria bacterium]
MFELKINNPTILRVDDNECILSLDDAIESIFPLETEHLVLIWNEVIIPLSFKYDISLMVLDFIKIFQFTKDNQSSRLEIHWASNTFAAIWNFEKSKYSVNINTVWRSVIGGTEDILNVKNKNEVSIDNLQKEIMKLLRFLKYAIEKSGVNSNLIEDFEKLREIFD